MNDGLYIQECSWSSVKHLFLQYHYLKSMPSGILACYGLFQKDGIEQCVGAAVFSNGRIQYDKIYLEFSRLWIIDDYGKNYESWFISKCLKLLEKKLPNYKGVVSWADPKRNHSGTIYLASNFVYDGESRRVARFDGYNRKTVYQRSVTDSRKPVGFDEPKKRFIYYFDCKKREQRIENQITLSFTDQN